jgi:hypothetical protein
VAGRRDLAIAIAGEIAAFLDLTERLDTIARARAAIAAIKAGERVDPQQLLFDDIAPMEPFPIYMARLPDIGRLGDLSLNVTAFYTEIGNLRRNALEVQRRHAQGMPAAEFVFRAEYLVNHYEELEGQARQLVADLRAVRDPR